MRAHFHKIHYVQPGFCVCERACYFQTLKTELKASSVCSSLAFSCNIICQLHLDFFPLPLLPMNLIQTMKSNQAAPPGLIGAACYSPQPSLVSSDARAEHGSLQTGMLS